MSPVTHFLAGWVVASMARMSRKERALVVGAAVAPDVDGLGIIPEVLTRHSAHPLLWFSEYHHSLHTLLFALVVALLALVLAQQHWKVFLLALLNFHLHLICDVAGSRGPDGYSWPIPYLKPFSAAGQWIWSGEWALNGWQNISITVVLMLVTLWIAWRYGTSPVEFISDNANAAFVRTLRARFDRVRASQGSA